MAMTPLCFLAAEVGYMPRLRVLENNSVWVKTSWMQQRNARQARHGLRRK
jgi:hypothetical protein